MPSPKQVLEYAVLGNERMENAALNGVVQASKQKDFVQRIESANPNVSNSNLNMDGSRSTHLMSSGDGAVFPQIIQRGGLFKRNHRGSGEGIDMGSDESAEWFANNYKRTNPSGFTPPGKRKLTDI